MKHISYILAPLMLLFTSCIYPFEPEGIKETSGIIVIEGDIIAGGTSFFLISYSQELTDITTLKSIVHAKVSVESSSGEVIQGRITYRNSQNVFNIDTRNLDIDQKYRLSVLMNDGEQYYSTWQTVEISPEIDSLSFYPDETNEVMRFYVSTHGDDNQRYYKWTYKEDWEYHSHYNSFFFYDYATDAVYEYPGTMNRYYCWNNDYSTSIMVTNTKDLTDNRLINHEIYSVGRTNNKISYIYSVEVYQQVISEEAYTYWVTLSKNSDDAGGLFSPQPSELRGNIYCAGDSTKPVLGYVGASTVTSKRIFVDQRKTLFWRRTEDCDAPMILSSLDWRKYYNYGYDVVDKVEEGMGVFSVYWAPVRCVDCTKKGGTKLKPSFWPNDHI